MTTSALLWCGPVAGGVGTNLAIAEGLIRGSGATSVRPVLDPQPDLCCIVFEPNKESAV